MKALRCFCLLLSVVTALGDLSRPQNLSLQTLNTQYVLHWDWADDQQTAVNGTLTFTAQYLSAFQSRKAAHKQKWRTVCADVSEHLCDFTDSGLNYWGIYYLRVRANTAQWFSSWTNISFCPDKDADLGPPSSVKLTSVKGDLEIVIADPLSSTNESMKTLAPDMHYLIQYWKKREDYKKAEVLKTKNNVVTLSELDGSTWYCVRVQSCCDFYNKTSVFSDTHCTRTEGQTPYWQIFLYFLLSLVLCFLLVLLVWFCFYKVLKSLKSIFYPNVQLPAHIQELWSPDSEKPQLLPPESPGSVCEHLDLISAEMDTVTDAQSLNSEDQDTSAPSRHGSGDSGFNSTEEDFSRHGAFTDVQTDDVCKTNRKHTEELHDGTLELCA
ncbi:interferon alpha/beta receptor 1a-like isoform X1 [Megalobrama amblycephala]|uniref:interferon alpha/beta receptor 1a-like isoform X1 n=1 Tax=Megalobrama amblycephala TaxID=75352 RepID=UPI0020141E2A|nr:interferon alpha/beta receptor 1a-like isoform X1 [Megalobrama amblycephala]